MQATKLYGNHLLDACSDGDRRRMAGDLHVRAMARREPTHERGEALQHVDFPIDAVMSVVASFANGDVCEVGTVGRESFVEADAALDSDIGRRNVFCQVAGDVVRMPVGAFRQELRSNPPFARAIRRNISARLFTSEQFTACNLRHALVERCARWLLMTYDRVGREEFELTHDLLSIMLGVRRAGVTVAAASLQVAGAIDYQRGHVYVRDRALLARAACECYETSKIAFEQSLLVQHEHWDGE